MNHIEQKELHEKIDELIGGFNGWETIDNFFKNNKEIQPVLYEVERECINNGCYGVATIYVSTIEKLLERLEMI